MNKKILFLSLFFILCFAYCFSANAQQINTISTRCPSPNQRSYSSIIAAVSGNILYTPCPTKSSIFSGNVDFSGATVTGIVSGSGTTNFIPRWTATETLGNTPFSWNGTIYNFNSTALNANYLLQFTPTINTGIFNLGDANSGITTTQSSQLVEIRSASNIRAFTANFGINNLAQNSPTTLSFITGATGSFSLGDFTSTPTTYFTQDYNTNTNVLRSTVLTRFNLTTDNVSCALSNSLGTFSCRNAANTSVFEFDGSGGNLNVTTSSGINFSALSLISTVSNTTFNAATAFTVTGALLDLTGVTNIAINKTNTAVLGDVTINKTGGIVNIETAADRLTVTNSLATTSSLILITAQRQDATCTEFVVTGKAAGSFEIRSNATCTVDTPVGFLVLN